MHTPSSQTTASTTAFVLYQSQLLGAYSKRLIHGFTGKPFQLKQTPEQVDHREQLAQFLNTSAPLRTPEQVHGTGVRSVSESDWSETDALIVDKPGLPAMILTADCTPVILYAPKQHVGAVIHAGWRGTAQAITLKTLERLRQDYDIQPSDLLAVIGPAIDVCCYEVSDEVAEALKASLPNNSPFSWLERKSPEKTKPHVSVPVVNQLQLRACGVQQIERLSLCTRCLRNQFWSHRRGEVGRQGAFLVLSRG